MCVDRFFDVEYETATVKIAHRKNESKAMDPDNNGTVWYQNMSATKRLTIVIGWKVSDFS